MKQLNVYADPATPNQRVYQVDEGVAGKASFDMLCAFRSAAFRSDLGIDAPGEKPKYNIPGQLQAIKGVGQIAFISPNYIVFKRDDASWDMIDPKIREVFADAFGEIETVNIVDGPLA